MRLVLWMMVAAILMLAMGGLGLVFDNHKDRKVIRRFQRRLAGK